MPLTAEQNERVTRTGRDTPAGRLLRRYWQPVALVEELDRARPVKAVRCFGEELVLFRDERGSYGLLERHCPHRGADLAFGRLEDGGLRCAFHGWLFDVGGQCLEMPAEPPDSTFCERMRHRAYPVQQRNGILFAYLGSDEPPALPHFDCFVAAEPYTFAFKGHIACNWLQAVEVGIDPAHASFLHRFFEDDDSGGAYGRQFRATSAQSDIPMTRVMREHVRPQISFERTPYGLQLTTLRAMDGAQLHVRITNLVFPNAFVIPMSPEMTIVQWHVPIDDVTNYWYAIFTSFKDPIDKDEMRRQRLQLYTLPDYKPRINRENDYGFDPHEQRTRTYTGMGDDINVHDQWAVESQGAIQDRTREHLGPSDKVIAAHRRLLLEALATSDADQRPLMVLDERSASAIAGPETIDTVVSADGWQERWQLLVRERRAGAPWSRKAGAAR